MSDHVDIVDAEDRVIRYEDAYTRLRGFASAVVDDGPLTLRAEEIVAGGFVALADAERLIATAPRCPTGAGVSRLSRALPLMPRRGHDRRITMRWPLRSRVPPRLFAATSAPTETRCLRAIVHNESPGRTT